MLDPVADLEQLFANDFSVAATYNGSTVRGIFDNEYRPAEFGGEVGVAGTDPAFTCRTSEINAAVEGETITISGVNYTIRDIMPDGTGVTELVLEKQ